MFIFAHIAIGLLIGKLTGNYWFALLGAVGIDIDHFYSYIKHGVLKSPKKFLKTITDTEDPWDDQRGVLHTFIALLVTSLLVLLYSAQAAIAFSIGYFSHLLFDMIDDADMRPFYPSKKNVKEPIRYFSRMEFIVTIIILIVYAII